MPKLPLILASQSPRRRELLTEAGYDFTVLPPDEAAERCDAPPPDPAALVTLLALRKAADVARRVERGLVLSCDTIVACDGRILGKPRDLADARSMLRGLRGREHAVYSGVCLWRRPDDVTKQAVDVTRLVMDDLADELLEEYLASGAWEGKAGAFGYQDRHGWIRILEGDESNVVGLPLPLLARLLREFEP